MRGASHRPVIVLLMAGILVASCGSPAASPSPAPSSSSTSAPTSTTAFTPTPAPAPTASAAPSATPADPFLGQVVVTVSDNLRVRSEPRVSDDSIKYEPLLPLGTELKVLDGPVEGSGYVWYQVSPVSLTGLEGPGYGWVAMAGKDGEPWIALANAPIEGIELAQADVARAPVVPAAAKIAAASINAFGLDLLRAMLADPALELADKNAVFSPTSIALALAMARAGAKGDTAAQMDAVLHTRGWDELGPGLNALEQALQSRNATWQEWDFGPTYEQALRIANAVFAQHGWSVQQAYLDALASAFGAGIRLVDFATNEEAARRSINGWVSQRTTNRIPELLGTGDVDAATRLVLVNAVYLKAVWEANFFHGATESKAFTRLDGSLVTVPMMRGESLGLGSPVPYARGNGWQATELRYEGGGGTPLAMTLVLPDDLPTFESRLTPAQLGRITGALTTERSQLNQEPSVCPDGSQQYTYRVLLYMPRFGIETKADLIPALRTVGITDAFDAVRADFTGTSAERPLYVSLVIHQANIDVDEKGTEAAAATGIGVTGGPGAGACRDITLRLDRPFLFILRDVETGAVLFMGRVVDPSAER